MDSEWYIVGESFYFGGGCCPRCCYGLQQGHFKCHPISQKCASLVEAGAYYMILASRDSLEIHGLEYCGDWED